MQDEIDIDRIVRERAGKKAKFVPKWLTRLLARIIHQDFIAYGGFMPFNLYANPYGPMTKWSVDKYAKFDENGNFINPDTAILPGLSQGHRLLRDHTQTNWNVKYADFPIDKYIYNAGYINLQNLQFGYNIPRKVLKKVGMTAAKIYFSGENLWNWSPLYKVFGRDFDKVLLDNASCCYCRSHQYEIASGWYIPFAEAFVREVLRRVAAGERERLPNEWATKTLLAGLADLQEKGIEAYRPSSPRTADEYRRVLTAASQIGAKVFAFQAG